MRKSFKSFRGTLTNHAETDPEIVARAKTDNSSPTKQDDNWFHLKEANATAYNVGKTTSPTKQEQSQSQRESKNSSDRMEFVRSEFEDKKLGKKKEK